MAGDLNVIAIIGRLTRESELKYSQAGGAICRFSIAVNRRKRTADNRWEDEANFFDCVYFGKSAEGVNQFLEKGRQVSITGELHQSRWEQDGQPRSRVEIYVNSLQLLGGGSNNGQQNSFASNNNAQRSPMQPTGNNNYQRNNPRPQAQAPQMPQDFGMGPESFSDDDDVFPF